MLIYLATNKINGQVYVGQTSLTLDQRRWRHEHESMNHHRKTVKFHNALIKYGFENFDWKVIAECGTQKELDAAEKYYIMVYESYKRGIGYNLKMGGRSGGLMTPEAKANLGASTKRKWQKPECAKRMREGLRKGTETCKRKAESNFEIRVCPICHTEFKVKPHEHKRYCSRDCVDKGNRSGCIERSKIAAAKVKQRSAEKAKQLEPVIYEWLNQNAELVINAKFNDLKFLKDLVAHIGVKDTRTLGFYLGLRYKKEIVRKLQDMIKYMPTNMETC